MLDAHFQRLRIEVLFHLGVADTSSLFDRIDERVADARRVTPGQVARRLAARHARRPTTVGHGLALPHAEVRRLRAPVLMYLRLLQGIAMGGDAEPVTDVVALLVPYPSGPRDHALLGRVHNALVNPTFVQQLRDCATREAATELWHDHLFHAAGSSV